LSVSLRQADGDSLSQVVIDCTLHKQMPPANQSDQRLPEAYSASLAFSFAASIEEIAPALERIVELAVVNGYDGEVELELRLAIQEALANAVVHGNACDPAKLVHCVAAADPRLGVLVSIRDEGPGFNAGAVSSPLRAEGLHASHGRGVHLIRELMDEVWFDDNGAKICFRKLPAGG
jgi:anti-sigma regulatory factor (Ser/Thr protein kinase)